MLGNDGFARVVTNVFQLSCGRAGGAQVVDTAQLRVFYLDFLEEIYPGLPINRKRDPFIEDPLCEARLAVAFTTPGMGEPGREFALLGGAYPVDAHASKCAFAREALEALLARDDELRAIFELVIHSVMIRQATAANGRVTYSSSSATAVGVIWLSLVDGLSQQDVQELFVHELTHQLLFIDDFVHAQFQYGRMAESENYAITAVSLSRRPLDIVIHSIVVAAEVLVARAKLLGEPVQPAVHPPSSTMVPTIAASYASVRALPNHDALVTPHIGALLRRSMAQVAALSQSGVP